MRCHMRGIKVMHQLGRGEFQLSSICSCCSTTLTVQSPKAKRQTQKLYHSLLFCSGFKRPLLKWFWHHKHIHVTRTCTNLYRASGLEELRWPYYLETTSHFSFSFPVDFCYYNELYYYFNKKMLYQCWLFKNNHEPFAFVFLFYTILVQPISHLPSLSISFQFTELGITS